LCVHTTDLKQVIAILTPDFLIFQDLTYFTKKEVLKYEYYKFLKKNAASMKDIEIFVLIVNRVLQGSPKVQGASTRKSRTQSKRKATHVKDNDMYRT
jgi:hypothetical protein